MLKRIITGIIMAIVLIPLFILSGWYYVSLGMILAYVAGYELLNMMEKEDRHFRRLKFIAPLWNSLLVLTSYCEPNLVWSVFGIGCLCFLAIMILNSKFRVESTILLIFTYLYTGLLFTFAFLNRNPMQDGYFNSGLYCSIFILLICIITDIGAYTFGLMFGKHRLCPTISPKKSVEGAIGGLLSGAVFATIYYLVVSKVILKTPLFSFMVDWHLAFQIIFVFLFSAFLSVASQIGDLVASKVKRKYDIKDYGFIFPGHGGVMDRFDSYIFAGAFFYLLMLVL